jgi:hypothetical protein
MSEGRRVDGVDGWPQPLGEAAFHGIAGDVVRTIDPHTEADPAAILIQFLVAVGNAVGRGAGFTAESTDHATNLYALVVGQTSKARKGSSWQQARRPVELADPGWSDRIVSGISSGEGLIQTVHDPEDGERDKRVLAYESEFASVLRVMRRDGSTTGMVIRQAWESGNLHTLTRKSPLTATGAHISIIGHIVQEELREELRKTDAASGFGNRFLFVCARRSKSLPEGGGLSDEDWQQIVPRLAEAIGFGRNAATLSRDQEARELWAAAYDHLSEGVPGLFGAITSRAEAQVMRLAVIYAVLDQAKEIRKEHLEAALAVWKYCEESARYLFADSLGDRVADKVLKELGQVHPTGRTRDQLRKLFGRHRIADQLDRALQLLVESGLIHEEVEPTRGRPRTLYYYGAESVERPDAGSLSAHTAQGEEPADVQLADASEIARLFSLSRDYVYAHRNELGAVQLGSGSRPRLRFDPAIVRERLGAMQVRENDTFKRDKQSAVRSGGAVPLLPVKGE